MAHSLTVTDPESNLTWLVRFVFLGDTYGRDLCLTHKSVDPLVEFYDTRYPHTQDENGEDLGQFVSRYYLTTLRASRYSDNQGINLDGGVAEWAISAAAMAEVWTQSKA